VCVRYVALGNLKKLIMCSSTSLALFPYDLMSSSFTSNCWHDFSMYLRI